MLAEKLQYRFKFFLRINFYEFRSLFSLTAGILARTPRSLPYSYSLFSWRYLFVEASLSSRNFAWSQRRKPRINDHRPATHCFFYFLTLPLDLRVVFLFIKTKVTFCSLTLEHLERVRGGGGSRGQMDLISSANFQSRIGS